MDKNFLCEKKLKQEAPDLHRLFSNSVFCLQNMLTKYKNIFPTYTDHTALHSIEVIDFCNSLIGSNIEQMNTDEIYVLLMAAYLHDSGMGITMSDYEKFRQNIDFGNYFDTHNAECIPDIIRDFHQEFSAEYINIKEEHIGIVTSNFHIYRSVKLAKKLGYKNVCGIAAESYAFLLPANMLRECACVVYYALTGGI